MSTIKDFKSTLHNDVSITDLPTYEQHTNLIKENRYNEAAALLSSYDISLGATASVLNIWEQKVIALEKLLLPVSFFDPYFYKDTEPAENEMEGKTIWQQEYE